MIEPSVFDINGSSRVRLTKCSKRYTLNDFMPSSTMIKSFSLADSRVVRTFGKSAWFLACRRWHALMTQNSATTAHAMAAPMTLYQNRRDWCLTTRSLTELFLWEFLWIDAVTCQFYFATRIDDVANIYGSIGPLSALTFNCFTCFRCK